MIFHDILSELEIQHLVNVSSPNLSRKRTFKSDTSGYSVPHELQGRRRIVHKTVQAWLSVVDYPPIEEYVGVKYNRVIDPLLWKLAKKVQLATQFSTQSQLSTTSMQVTNYGLGGLCDVHIDPHGISEVKDLPPDRQGLKITGDMIGTVQAIFLDFDSYEN